MSLASRRFSWVFSLAAACWAAAMGGAANAAEREVLRFRLLKWKALHVDDANTAKSHLAMFKKIGCEAEQARHADHFDVKYRCAKWRQLSFRSHREAHQWAHWLDANGFETVFVEPDKSTHLETVSYRLPAWKAIHLDRGADAAARYDTFKMLGCDAKQARHAGHYDVQFRCSKWRTIGLESDREAHEWQKWLNSLGFETRHEHKAVRSARRR